MAAEHDYNYLSIENPKILLQMGSETRADVWFSPAECRVTSSDLDEVCNDLFQRSHGAILVDVTELNYGVLTVQQNPAIESSVDLEKAVRRLADRLCEFYSDNLPY